MPQLRAPNGGGIVNATEIINCSRCGTPTMFEGNGTYPEGEKCDGPCDRWVCPDCMDDSVQDENLCQDCAKGVAA